jgi:hypothetical protein
MIAPAAIAATSASRQFVPNASTAIIATVTADAAHCRVRLRLVRRPTRYPPRSSSLLISRPIAWSVCWPRRALAVR